MTVGILLEGNFDNIWGIILDYAFMTRLGVLHRKEKSSPHSSKRFDGLFIDATLCPQEWMVIEVARSSNLGGKQLVDQQKVAEHAIIILEVRFQYLRSRFQLRGRKLTALLKKFPVWAVVCQGEYHILFRYIFR